MDRRARAGGLPRARHAGSPGTKVICLDHGFARPGLVEVEFGVSLRDADRERGGRRPGRVAGRLKAVQIGGPLGGIVPPASLLDTPFDFAPLASVGCMV